MNLIIDCPMDLFPNVIFETFVIHSYHFEGIFTAEKHSDYIGGRLKNQTFVYAFYEDGYLQVRN